MEQGYNIGWTEISNVWLKKFFVQFLNFGIVKFYKNLDDVCRFN